MQINLERLQHCHLTGSVRPALVSFYPFNWTCPRFLYNIEAIENDPNEIVRLGLFEAYDSPIDAAEKDDELLLPTAQPEFALELESDESPYTEIIVSANGESEYDRTDGSVVDTADDFSGSESFSHLNNTVSVITSALPDSQSKSEMHEMKSSLSETKVDNSTIESRSKGDRKPLSDRFDFVELPESSTSRSASAVQLAADHSEGKTNSNWWTNMCGLLLIGMFACFAISSFTSNNKIDSAANLNLATGAGAVSGNEGSNLDRLSQSPLVQSDLAGNSGWKLSKLNIEDIQVGMRVPAQNPLEEEIENESIDPATWRKVRLKMNRGNGSEMQITLLRSEAWIRESLVLANGLTALDQAAIGQRIEFNVDELDATGFAEILSVEPCPPIIDGPGEVVTATYHSKSVPVIDLKIDGFDEPVGVTHDHPIWSEDRHDFVKAGELQAGETLQLIDDQLVRLTNIEPRAGPEDVFNFEVANQHVYYVGDGGLLVHNASQGVYLSQLTRLEKMRDAADAAGDATKVAKIDALILKTGQKLHGNSTKFTGAQEGYAIVNSLTGEILKVGVTNAKIGVKARHAQQAANVTKLTGVKEANQILVKLKDIPAKANARGDILKWEKDFSGFMLGTGNPLPAHKTPRIPFFFN